MEKHMRKGLIFLCGFCIIAAFAVCSVGAQEQPEFSIKIWPSKIELTGSPGTTQDFSINVQNSGREDQNLKIYFNDYYISPENTFVYKEPGHYSYSCAKWLKSQENKIEVPTGATAKANFDLTVPKKAEPGGHYAVIFFEKIPKESEGQTAAQAVPRVGVVMLVTVPGEIVRKLEIEDVSVTGTWFWPSRKVLFLPRKKVTARVVVRNPGNVHVTAKGKITYTPTFGWGAGVIELEEITILPKTKRYMEAEIPNPPMFGSYEVKAQVEYGPDMYTFDTEITGETTFQSYPIGLLLLILLLIALVVGAYELILWWRRKRKAKREGGKEKDKEEGAEEEEKPEKKGGKEKDKKEPEKEPEAEEDRKETGDVLRDHWNRLKGIIAAQLMWTERMKEGGKKEEPPAEPKAKRSKKKKEKREEEGEQPPGGPDEDDFQSRSPMKLFDD